MSAVLKPSPGIDLQTFLAWEELQPERHEFIGGEVYAMTGARATHNTIALNLAIALRQGLKGTPCRTHMESVKVRVESADAVVYPDVFVTCDPVDLSPDAELQKTAPKLIVEVLSDSTAAYDRGRKFELYQQLPSLEEYLLVEADRQHADLFRRNADGLWVLHPAGPEATVELASVGLAISMTAIYEDVEHAGQHTGGEPSASTTP
jgi:Uma2 family endonuclease